MITRSSTSVKSAFIKVNFCLATIACVLCATVPATAQPAVTTPPLSRTNNIGDNAQFTVTATGTAPLSYQWRRNGSNISGANGSVYNLLVTNTGNAGTYSVVVTDGSALSTTSSDAVLSVFFADRTKFLQWNFNSLTPDNDVSTGVTTPSVGSGGGVTASGASANGFNTGSASDPAQSDNSSRRWNALTSSVANKTAGAKFAFSTAGYQNIAISGELWLAARSSAYWRGQYTVNGTDWIDRNVINRHALALAGFYYFADDLTGVDGVADNPNFAYRVVAEYESTATGSGADAYVSVDPASTFNAGSSLFGWDMSTVFGTPISQQPVITLQPQSHTNYVNTAGGFTVKATGGNLLYQWYFNNGLINFGTNSDLVLTNVQYSNAGTYHVVVHNEVGTVTSDDAILTVEDVVLPQGDRYWSADGATAGGSGGGNWDTNTPNRWGLDIGGPFNLQWNNTRLDNAIFAPGSGVINNSFGVAVNTITLTNAPGVAYTFGGAGSISFLGPDSSIYVAGANNANASNLLSTSCQVIGSVVTKNGGGRFHLGNTNNIVGRWIVNQGALTSINASNLFGSQPSQALSNYITLDGGGLGFIAPGAMSLGANRGIYLGPNGGQIGNQGTGGIITVDAPITGPGSLHFPGTTEWPGQLQGDNCTYIISNTNNDYQGVTRIAIPEVRLGANQVFPIGTTLLISNLSIGGRLNLNGFNQTVAKVILDSTSGNSRIFDTVGTGSLSAAEFDLRRSASAVNVSAVLAGPGTLTKTTSGNITLAAPNTYTGDTFLQAGTLTLNAAGRFGSPTGTVHLQGGSLVVAESRTDTNIVMNPMSLEGETLIQGTANATNNIVFLHGGTWSMQGGVVYVFNPNTNGFLFQVGLTNVVNFTAPIDVSTSCQLVSYNSAGTDQAFSGGISGLGILRRSASSGVGGRTILTTDNTYSGGTIVDGGELVVNNPFNSATGSGPVTVASAGTLSGTGTISGAVAVTVGGNIAATVNGGMLTLQGGLDLSGGGTNTWNLAALKDDSNGAPGTDFGQIVLTAGELQLGGSSVLTLKFSGTAGAPDASVGFWQSTHHWKIINVSGGLNSANATFVSIANGSYGAGSFSTAVDGTGSIILTFTAAAQSGPSITTHPQSRTSVAGTTASFTVSASGSQPLTYAWFRSASPFTPISGATNTTFTIANVKAADAGSYFARAYNNLGNDTSQLASLTVVPPPTIGASASGTSNFVVTVNTLVGTQYQVQYNTNLATTNWIPLTAFAGNGGIVSVTNNPAPGETQRYIRILLQ